MPSSRSGWMSVAVAVVLDVGVENREDAHDLAGEQAVAGDLHLGVVADQMAILAGDAQLELDVARRVSRVGRMASISPASMPWMRTRVPTSTPLMSGKPARTRKLSLPQPERSLRANKARAAEDENTDDEKSEQHRLRAGEDCGTTKTSAEIVGLGKQFHYTRKVVSGEW